MVWARTGLARRVRPAAHGSDLLWITMNSSGPSLFGAKLTADGVQNFIERVTVNAMEGGGDRTPICVWGVHGIGKTALVEEIASANGWKFAYVAPAQFEEMGDLHGLPVVDGDSTRFAAPDWVPTKDGPGILLLDDFNRADDRILRGIMQLLQRGELVSWSLPPRWHIVVTANPEGSDYSVTPLDDAMLTRMLHVSMEFEHKVWARWAVDAGVDERGIAFVLTYPEMVTGSRTTPRSLTHFFQQISLIEDLRANWDHVHALALSALDPEAATAFMSFVNDGLNRLVSPEEILDNPWAETAARIDELAHDENGVRLDRLNAMTVRLYLAATKDGFVPTERQGANLVSFLTNEVLPADLRLTLHRDLVNDAGPEVVAVMRDKALAEMTLESM